MQISPIKNNLTYNLKKNNKNTYLYKTQANTLGNISFKGTNEENTIMSELFAIKNSAEFASEMNDLRKNTLLKEISLEDFLVSAMRTVSKYSNAYPIKEDFFEYKAKNRFVEIVKKYLNKEIENYENPEKLNELINSSYWWGFNGNKYGSSKAYTVAVLSILPYAEKYEKDLGLSKLAHQESRESDYRQTIENQKKELRNKEFIDENYFQPLLALRNNPNINLPNAIMIESKNPKEAEELINWMLLKTPCGKTVIENNETLSKVMLKNRLKSKLDSLKQTYENHGVPTLIYCENFDKLIDSSNTDIEIAGMKALLSSMYSKYGVTIVFSTTDSTKINNTIKQPHRMKSVNIDYC